MNVARALLRDCIDYAGLFPPAGLKLAATVRKYAAYRESSDAWALGRLVLPVKDLTEVVQRWPEFASDWPISLLLGADYGAEIREATGLGVRLEMVECRPARIEHISEIRRRLPSESRLFIEAPLGVELDDVLRAVACAGACAKIRTGGITAEAIPTTRDVAAFLVSCARNGLMFKATAGLHHAVRGVFMLTNEESAPRAPMHGYVNFLVAAALACEGKEESEVSAALADENRAAFRAVEDVLCWRGHEWTTTQLTELRQSFAVSFGSCSFEEPLEEMRVMGWLD